jgi:hypothetical protein
LIEMLEEIGSPLSYKLEFESYSRTKVSSPYKISFIDGISIQEC